MRRSGIALLFLLAACPGNGNQDGDAGDDDGNNPDGPVIPGPRLIEIAAGSEHTCVLLEDRTVRCWGDNRAGQLGNGSRESSVRPVVVTGLSNIASVAAGHEHSCAVLTDGTARCWGNNANGQLGNNTKIDSDVPVTVEGLSGIRSIHPGVSVTCALNLTGNVFCWGRGGELGDGTVDEALTPRRITSLTQINYLSVSSNGGRSTSIHVCGVRVNGTVFCWGANDDGQCGNGQQGIATTPVDVTGITDATEVSAGGGHACAKRGSNTSCWGAGQLIGDGTNMRQLTATPVSTALTFASVYTGDNFSIAQANDASLHCWGQSGRGECGDGADFTPGGPVYLAPVATLTSHFDTTVHDAGGAHACAYNESTSVTTCWGSNDFGELGSGTPASGSRTQFPQAVVW